MRTRLAHLVLVLAGVLVMLYPLTFAGSAITCRGVAMRAGDVCLKADGSTQQTYAEREATRRGAIPVIEVVGLGMTAFGIALLVSDLRRRRVVAPSEGAGFRRRTPSVRRR